MCCRYYYSDRSIDKVLADLQIEPGGALGRPAGEIRPGGRSVMIYGKDGSAAMGVAQWGLPEREGGLVINARAESVFEKPMFRSSALYRRCVLPAERFYEWDQARNMVTFLDPLRPLIYLAGIWKLIDDVPRFTVLTTEANASMRPVHDRMPLMLERADVGAWLRDTGPVPSEAVRAITAKEMPMLDRYIENEQISMF